MPTNQRNRRSNSSRSINCRSEGSNRTPAKASPAEASLAESRDGPSAVERRELPRKNCQSLVHDQPDDPKRVIFADPPLQIDVAKQRPRPFIPAPHPFASAKANAKESQDESAGQRLSQRPARRDPTRNAVHPGALALPRGRASNVARKSPGICAS